MSEQQTNTKTKEKSKKRIRIFIKRHKVVTTIIALVIVGAIVLSIVLLNGKNDKTSYSYIRTTTLAKGSLDNSISATGTVESAETSNVTTSLNYTVKTIAVSVGDKVKEGDIICTLDTQELEDQIEKEQKNLEKSKKSAQNSYNSAKENYDSAKKKLDSYKTELNTAKSTYDTAKAPYLAAKKAINTYQNQYDKALKNYNNAGKNFVEAQNKYNSACNKTKSKDAIISAAKNYMTTAQNLYGGLNIGTVDISSGSSSSSVSSNVSSGLQNFARMSAQSANSGSSTSVSVTTTANDICKNVISKVYSLTGTTLTTPSGSNTLYNLSNKAKSLQNAKSSANFYNLESEYNTAKTTYDTAKQTYNQYKDAVSQANQQLTQASEQLDNASSSDTLTELQKQLKDCSIKANQDGTITALNATIGSAVSMGGSASAGSSAAASALSSGSSSLALATICNLDKLKISITISEADINNAKTGMSCYITSDASEQTFNGTLTQIDPVANDAGTFGAEVTVDSENSGLLVGMNASVEILVNSTDNVFSVPIDAVGNDNDNKGDYIYRKTSGEGTEMKFEKVYVTKGEKNDYYIEVSADSLKEGDVIRSTSNLEEGIETVDNDNSDDQNNFPMFANGSNRMNGGMGGQNGGSSNGGQNGGNGNMPSPPNTNGGQ